jgi:ATP-binding cassette subfamily F protein uup
MTAEINEPAFYQRDNAAITAHNIAMAAAQGDLAAAYARWAELDA